MLFVAYVGCLLPGVAPPAKRTVLLNIILFYIYIKGYEQHQFTTTVSNSIGVGL